MSTGHSTAFKEATLLYTVTAKIKTAIVDTAITPVWALVIVNKIACGIFDDKKSLQFYDELLNTFIMCFLLKKF